MAHTLTHYADDIINRLVHSGRYNNRSEVVRAGLRLLEQKEFGHLNAPVLSEQSLTRAYRRQKNEGATESAATRASRRRKPKFNE